MHVWLPIMSMVGHITGNKQCPGCPCRKDPIDHIILCPCRNMKNKREETIVEFQKKGLNSKIPRSVTNAIRAILKKYFNNEDDYLVRTYHPSIKAAIAALQRIGFIHLCIRGFLATAWIKAMSDSGSSKPERRMPTLQKTMWMK